MAELSSEEKELHKARLKYPDAADGEFYLNQINVSGNCIPLFDNYLPKKFQIFYEIFSQKVL